MNEGIPKQSTGASKKETFRKDSITPTAINLSMPRYYTKGPRTFDRTYDDELNEIDPTTTAEKGRTLTEYMNLFGLAKRNLYGKVILDLGAGRETLPAVELQDKATVISLSPDFVDGKHRVELSDGPETRVAALGSKLPFDDNTFDVIFLLHVLDHIDDNQKDETRLTERYKTIKEVVRVLKKGGIAYIGPIADRYFEMNAEWSVRPEKIKVQRKESKITEREYNESGFPRYSRVPLETMRITKR